jgi:voltage-gated potassium channel
MTLFRSARLQFGCGLLALVLTIGTIGFMLTEGWTLLQSLYTAVLVVSTLGFSDLRPSDAPGQTLTIGLILLGVGTLYYLVGALAQNVIENQFEWNRRRSMEQRVAQLKDHLVVCGFGRVGRETCQQLKQQNCAFVVVDSEERRIHQVDQLGYFYVQGDASDDEVLKRAGVTRARALLTAVQTDAANVYITLSARALNPELFIVARAATAEAEHKLAIAGANRVISPYILGGRSMAGHALRPTVMDFLDVLVHSDEMEMWLEEINVGADSWLNGMSIGDAQLRQTTGIIVLALRRADGQIQVNPKESALLREGDTLIVLGSREDVERIDHQRTRR